MPCFSGELLCFPLSSFNFTVFCDFLLSHTESPSGAWGSQEGPQQGVRKDPGSLVRASAASLCPGAALRARAHCAEDGSRSQPLLGISGKVSPPAQGMPAPLPFIETKPLIGSRPCARNQFLMCFSALLMTCCVSPQVKDGGDGDPQHTGGWRSAQAVRGLPAWGSHRAQQRQGSGSLQN